MMNLSTTLSSIVIALRHLNRNILLRSLQDGISVQVLRSALRGVGISSTPQLEELYNWKDGTSTAGVTLDDIQLFPGFYMLSIEDSVKNYSAFVADPRWRTGWLPLFANGGGDFYILDIETTPTGQIRHFRIEESEHPVEFTSLVSMMATLATAYERGIFYVDPNGYLEMVDLTFGKLAAELNPDVEWWQGWCDE